MSSEQITQTNVPVEETTTTTDTPQQTEQTISSTATVGCSVVVELIVCSVC